MEGRVRAHAIRAATVAVLSFPAAAVVLSQTQGAQPAPAQAGAPAAPSSAAAARWFAHVERLANDDMRGRETGSPEHRQAAEYVAARFKEVGLAPGGMQGYFEPVRLTSRRLREEASSLAIVANGTVTPVAPGEQARFTLAVAPAPVVEAPLVFAGYGLQVPEAGIDDFAGLDVRGKIVVQMGGRPPNLSGPLGSHVQSAGVRAATLRRLGAIGYILLPPSASPPRVASTSEERPASGAPASAPRPTLALADPAFDDGAGLQIAVTFTAAHAEGLFAGSGHTFAEVAAQATARQPLPRFPLAVSLRATASVEATDLWSDNVVGLLRGSDPVLADEYVVLTAHLDHVGVGRPVAGDSIYNGAMDNASGIATLIEVARTLASARPRRSVLFVAVTGEEHGLLGSRHFARRPTVPRSAVVANLNMDMFLPLYPFRSFMVLGLDESDLGDDVRAVAAEMGVGVQADPQPERNRFVRSDQYSFIREGIPALAFKIGVVPGSPEAAVEAAWTRERYHAPSDDLQQPIDHEAAAAFTDGLGRVAMRVANRPTRPAWKTESFFKRFAAAPVSP